VLEVLGDLIYVPTQYFALADHVDLSLLGDKTEELSKGPNLLDLCAIGAALRAHSEAAGRQSINLLEPQVAEPPVQPWSAVWGVRAAAGVLAATALMGLGLNLAARHVEQQKQQYVDDTAQLRRITASMPAMPDVTELASLRKTQERQLRMRDALKGAMVSGAPAYSNYLEALARHVQPNLWITGLSLRDEGRDLELTGRMIDQAALPVYITRLQDEPNFRGRRFAQVSLQEIAMGDELGGGPKVSEFSLRSRIDLKELPTSKPLPPGLQEMAVRR
jgi:Fimbrial assembly protein (PilN)